MTLSPEDPRAEAFLRRAAINAELRGENVIVALRTAREAVEKGEHLHPSALVDEAVKESVRRIVAFLGRCYDEEVVFEEGGQMLSAQQVWSDIVFVFGDGVDEEEICQGIFEMIGKAAGC